MQRNRIEWFCDVATFCLNVEPGLTVFKVMILASTMKSMTTRRKSLETQNW